MIQRAHLTGTELDLALTIRAEHARVTLGQTVRIHATLTNLGTEPVTLVDPGDGSEAGWRTPIIGWSILGPTESDSAPPAGTHPDEPPLVPARGGNVNPLSRDEIFELAPGEARRLNDWIDVPRLRSEGVYRLVFYYRNDPGATVEGLPFDEHDPVALRQISDSTACALVSNEIRITVGG